jgi:alpha-tubulin suppressor-like RCC1 family protein
MPLVKIRYIHHLSKSKYGELGVGSKSQSLVPILLDLKNIIKVSAGQVHSLFLNGNGRVFATGGNGVRNIYFKDQYGELGDGTIYNRLSPVEIIQQRHIVHIFASDQTSMILNSDGAAFAFGYGTVFHLI